MKFDIVEKKFTVLAWLAILVIIPSFSIFGRGFQRALEEAIGSKGIGIMFGSVIGLILLGTGIWIMSRASKRGLWHLAWVAAIAGGIMYYVIGNPERWYHLPFFGTAGFLSVQLFDVRTGAEVAVAVAFFDEFLQFFLPQRTGSVEDVFINALSAGLGITIWVLVQPGYEDRPLSIRRE